MSKIVWILIIFCWGHISLNAQQQTPEKADSQANEMYLKAHKLHQTGQYPKAKKAYQQIIKKYPEHINSYLGVAGICYLQEDWENCQSMLDQAVSIDSLYDTEMYFSLGLVHEKLKNHRSAIQHYTTYTRLEKEKKEKLRKAQDQIKRLSFIVRAMDNPVAFAPVDPGPGINSSSHEYWASVDITGKTMVFTKRVNGQEDLYISRKTDGVWQPAEPVTELNTTANEGAHCISADGKTIIFTICDRKDSFGSCDLYISNLKNGNWSHALNMGSRINSAAWDGQPSLSADGRTLYFVSTRLGTIGGKDIWVSKKNEDNSWSVPENLGPKINTTGDEEAPFIYPDNKSLYFSSTGHTGMGGRDLFLARKSESGWCKPVNLGYPVNTEYDEGTLIVSPDGKTAFFSSDRTDLDPALVKNLNIYQFELPASMSSNPVSYATGSVKDRETMMPLSADILLYDNESGELIHRVKSDTEHGFLIALPNGKNYNLTIRQPGYLLHSENFKLTDDHPDSKPYELSILLIPLAPEITREFAASDKITVLNNIFFEFGSSSLDFTLSKAELENLVDFLKSNPDIHIEIAGHTDNIGSSESNLTLSLDRAKAIFDYCTGQGVQEGRMTCKGYGETKPVATNETAEGRSLNRRTEFRIIE